MASSRESSPGNDPLSTSPHQLTPKSKIKALLASLDNDSDDESTPGSARARLASIVTKRPTTETPPSLNPKTTDENSTPQELAKDSSSDGDDEDEDIVRPKGRMAARMLATNGHSVENDGDSARERVKRMLMNSTKGPEPTISDGDAEDNEKSDTSIVPRKRKVRAPRRGTPTSSPVKSPAHSALFVSPAKSTDPASNASDSEELPANPLQNERFKALVEKKRQERLAKEALEATQKEKRMTERRTAAIIEEDEVNDDFMERRLTQQTKPTRKASKAAIEKIAQETQRMSRSMQLTHDARTKSRFSKVDLFDIYEYNNGPDMNDQTELASSSPARHYSDIEMHETPPTSPLSHESDVEKSVVAGHTLSGVDGLLNAENLRQKDEDLLPRDFSLAPSSPRKLNKGKEKATEKSLTEPKLENMPQLKQRLVRIRPPIAANGMASTLDDSDSDLEILTVKIPAANMAKSNTLFDRVPAKQASESHSIHTLKMLSHLESPRKQIFGRNQKAHMTATELQLSLQQRARLQAAREKEEKFEALKAKGVILPTAEEREKALAEVEDLMAKARREGEDIRQKEKAAAKKERKENGEEDPLGDSSDDEDWDDGKENPEELSGSGSEADLADAIDASSENEDEEDDELALEDEEKAQSNLTNAMLDNEADETDDHEVEAQLSIDEDMVEPGDLEDAQEDEGPAIVQRARRARNSNVISDDEDEDGGNPVVETPSAPRTGPHTQRHTDSPIAPNSVLRSATKTFIPGFPVIGAAGLGLTQIFAGTMGESQLDESQLDACDESTTPNACSQIDSEQDSLAFLRRLPAPDLPPFVPTMESSQVVMDSQPGSDHITESQSTETQAQTQGLQLMFSQSQIHGFDSLVDPMATQLSGFPSATQDVGFQQVTPVKGRFAEPPPSTVDTLVMEPQEETPIVKKKGKLRRRVQVAAFSDDEDAGKEPVYAEDQENDFEISANVFDIMRKASKKTVVDEFDKKTSKAKEMVNEQADESEDEYAGLGGASDDESGDEEDEYVKEMIDDEGGKDADERKLAAFFADRERANDEKQVEKLYSDITKGMLRRKRGADYDLSDSDDGGEARKRMKRKEFAKMRKALLADERIGKIAENPKKQAFLRALQDRGSDDELDFLDEFADQDEATDSQMSQAEVPQQRVPDSQPDTAMGPPKRKLSDEVEPEPRAPPHLRRTVGSKRPSNLTEIRESLSSLIEEPNAMAALEADSDSEGDLEIEEADLTSSKEKEKENRDPFSLRRKNIPVVDRISLKRASSSSLSSGTRLAFAASSSAPGFQVPPLLRRATTNNSLASTSSSTSSVNGGMSATERMAGSANGDGVKRGGGKNSGVHYFARENERRAAIVKTEERRERRIIKGAEVRRKAAGGLFGGGKFE